MKPKLRFGRAVGLDSGSDADGEDPATAAATSHDDPIDNASPSDELPRPANSAPIRFDLGPPAPGPQSANQPGSGLGLVVSVATSIIVFMLAIYATGSPTANPLPLAQTTNTLFWAVAVVALIAVGAGAEYADRTASRAQERPRLGPVSGAWIVPTVATAAAIVLVATFHNTTMIVAGPLVAFLGSAGALLSRDLLDDADDSAQRTATTIHTLVIHVVAFLALSAIYLNKLPSPLTALVAGVIAGLLTVEVIDRSGVAPSQKLLLALLAGGTVAAAATPLHWWLTHGWTGGAVLFIVFYWAAGMLQTGIARGGFRARDAIEYAVVPLAALLLLAITA